MGTGLQTSTTRAGSRSKVDVIPSSRVRRVQKQQTRCDIVVYTYVYVHIYISIRSVSVFILSHRPHPFRFEKRDLFYRSAARASPVSRPFAKLDPYAAAAETESETEAEWKRERQKETQEHRIIKIYYGGKSTLCISDKSKIRGWILWASGCIHTYSRSYLNPEGSGEKFNKTEFVRPSSVYRLFFFQ